nr:MAG: RNA-dependent RNA polymerase [Totiviridae sp.]
MSGEECLRCSSNTRLTVEAMEQVMAGFMQLELLGKVELYCSVMVSLAARGFEYDPAFVMCVLVGSDLFGRVPPPELREVYRHNTSLLPEGWMRGWRPQQICEHVRSAVIPDPSVIPVRGSDWDELLCQVLASPEDDSLALALFPPRNRADLGVRNVRLADLLSFYRCHPEYGDTSGLLRQLKFFDYICVCNILLARVVFWGTGWWDIVLGSGLLAAGAEHFRLAGKALSDFVKKERVLIPADLRTSLYEVASLYGAMTPPVPGWDPVEETEALAKSGQSQHGLLGFERYGQPAILEAITRLGDIPGPPARKAESFRSWLESAVWERSGSSSIGDVEYELSDGRETERGHFRARKNLILDVKTPDELESLVLGCDRQENNALVKAEFSKIRIAVSSPLAVYLGQSWFYDLAGTFYKNWPGNTLEETAGQEAFRTEQTYAKLQRGEYALPYDFNRFDHQPRLDEILAFHDVLVRKALAAADPVDRPTVLRIAEMQRKGFLTATLRSPPGLGDRRTFSVTGGLMSGLRSTSCVGSGWNLVLGTMAQHIVGEFRSCASAVRTCIYVRGDDTQVLSSNYHDVLGVKLCYDALGAEANESKFSLRQGRSEFLRIEVSDRARGYPCRTVPLVTQRRPWNARPVGPEAVVGHVSKVLSTLARRTADPRHVDAYRKFHVDRIMGLLGLDPRLKDVPIGAGGFGIEPWSGRWLVTRWRSSLLPPVCILNATDFRHTQVVRELQQLRLPVKSNVVASIVQARRTGKMALDDIPKLGGVARRLMRAELRERQFVAADVDRNLAGQGLVAMCSTLAVVRNVVPGPGAYQSLVSDLEATVGGEAALWGSCRREVSSISLLAEYARHSKYSLGQVLRRHRPLIWNKLLATERRYGVRRNVALDILTGSLAVSGSESMNPLLPRVARLLGMLCLARTVTRRGQASAATAYYAFQQGAYYGYRALASSPYGQTLLSN